MVECPQIKKCMIEIDQSHFEFMCNSEAWTDCTYLSEEVKKKLITKKKPREWKEIFEETDPSRRNQ